MEGINPPKYSRNEVSQKFNLKKILGYEPSDAQKEIFYELVVERIVQRTARGKDINGDEFEKYSEAYAQRKGVISTSVDLILEGDMLNAFEPSSQKNVIKVKIEDGLQTDKAYNHNVGDTLPKRTFFGVTDDEVSKIKREVDKYKPTKKEPKTIKETAIDLADLRRAIQETIDIEIEGFDGQN